MLPAQMLFLQENQYFKSNIRDQEEYETLANVPVFAVTESPDRGGYYC